MMPVFHTESWFLFYFVITKRGTYLFDAIRVEKYVVTEVVKTCMGENLELGVGKSQGTLPFA